MAGESHRSPAWSAAGGLFALAAALGIGRFVFTPILPLMIEDLGMTKTSAGLLASSNNAGYLVGALIASAPSTAPASYRSRLRWVMLSLVASAITTGAMGWGSTVAVCLLLRFAGGVASAFVMVFSSALVLDRLAVAGRSHWASLHFAGVGFGIGVSAVLVSVLEAAGAGWRPMWFASGLVALVFTGLALAVIPGASATGATRPVATGATARPSGIRLLATAYGLFGFGYVITSTFLVTIVRASDEVKSLEHVLWLTVGIMAAVSVTFWGRVSRRMGNAGALCVALLVEAAGVAASAGSLAQSQIAAAILLGGTFMGITALGLAEARQRSPGDAGGTLGVMTAAFGLGQIVGPLFAGLLHDFTGSFAAPTFASSGALVVAAGLVLASSRRN